MLYQLIYRGINGLAPESHCTGTERSQCWAKIMATIRKRGNRYQAIVRRIETPPISKSFGNRSDALR
jgi:hypothetical protein